MDRDEFGSFYERTAPALRRYLARVAGSVDLADDLMQEAFIRVIDAAPAGEAHRRAYLYRTATNLVMDHFRANRRERAGLLSWFRSTPAAFEPSEAASDVERAFQSLNVRERALLWLAHVEGATHEEIAGVLGLRAKSVRVLLFRARRRMAEFLENGGRR
jgi:RNA polymerase sigma-70 factor (ECF subfamily)